MSQVDRKLVKNYFTKKFPVWTVVVGLIGLITLSGSALFGIILLAIAGAGLYFMYFGKATATDQQVDEAIQQDCLGAVERGRDKVGIVEEMELKEPIVIKGAYYKHVNNETRLLYKRGGDGQLRFSLGQITVFYITENQLYCYTRVIDFCTGSTFTETTDEYFYKDIVSVATLSEKIQVLNEKGLPVTDKKTNQPVVHDVEVFKLTTSGGTSIQANVQDRTAMSERKGLMDISMVEEQIKAMRNILREKKAV
ncbi:hypothetical protein [Paenibacillus andongensis]|uniref:hypothetical protein n=1 Tax=Paenibacillus andongensis TaxID=2975482 RepID=UPI0021BADB5E|nr:hypothetical protein [Paenibacillus andongensis]